MTQIGQEINCFDRKEKDPTHPRPSHLKAPTEATTHKYCFQGGMKKSVYRAAQLTSQWMRVIVFTLIVIVTPHTDFWAIVLQFRRVTIGRRAPGRIASRQVGSDGPAVVSLFLSFLSFYRVSLALHLFSDGDAWFLHRSTRVQGMIARVRMRPGPRRRTPMTHPSINNGRIARIARLQSTGCTSELRRPFAMESDLRNVSIGCWWCSQQLWCGRFLSCVRGVVSSRPTAPSGNSKQSLPAPSDSRVLSCASIPPLSICLSLCSVTTMRMDRTTHWAWHYKRSDAISTSTEESLLVFVTHLSATETAKDWAGHQFRHEYTYIYT